MGRTARRCVLFGLPATAVPCTAPPRPRYPLLRQQPPWASPIGARSMATAPTSASFASSFALSLAHPHPRPGTVYRHLVQREGAHLIHIPGRRIGALLGTLRVGQL